jgi:hypothetical protein
MKNRYCFVSNSSSMSFIIPKRVLSDEDCAILQGMVDTGDMLRSNETLYATPSYFCGRVDSFHPIIGLVKHYGDKEGVDCYED